MERLKKGRENSEDKQRKWKAWGKVKKGRENSEEREVKKGENVGKKQRSEERIRMIEW